jgi:hypothetical protein
MMVLVRPERWHVMLMIIIMMMMMAQVVRSGCNLPWKGTRGVPFCGALAGCLALVAVIYKSLQLNAWMCLMMLLLMIMRGVVGGLGVRMSAVATSLSQRDPCLSAYLYIRMFSACV